MMNFLRYLLMLPSCIILINSAQAQRIFWAERNNNRLMVGDLTLTSITNMAPYISSLDNLEDIAIDPSKTYIFYTLQGGTALWRRNYDGSSPFEIQDFGAFSGFKDIAYSDNAGGLFCVRSAEERRAIFYGYDGSGPVSLPMGSFGVDEFNGVAVDDGNEQVFFTSYDSDLIIVTDFSGSFGSGLPTGGGGFEEIAADINNSKIYYSAYVSGSNYGIFSANMNGTNASLLQTIPGQITSIQVYPKIGKVYFSGNNSIYQMNLDGTALTQLVNIPGANITDIAIEPDFSSPVFTALSPADNSTLVNPAITSITMTFNENVRVATDAGGGLNITITENGTTLSTIPRGSSNISISGNLVTITLPTSLQQLKDYYVQIGNNVFEDMFGNDFSGITLSTGWNFSTQCVSLTPGTASGNQSSCANGDPTLITGGTATGGDGTFTYQWQASTISSTGGYADIPSAMSADYDPPAGITTTTYFRRVVNSATCTPAIGNFITVTVTPPIAITTEPVPQTTCEGTPVLFTVQATGTSLTYQWQADVGSGFNNISNGSIYTGVTTSQLSVATASGMNGYRYRCIVSSSGLCPVNSQPAALTLNSLPAVKDLVLPICEDIAGSGTAVYDLTSLESTIVTSTSGLTLTWYQGSVPLQISNPATAVVSSSSIIFVEVVDNNTDCSNQAFVDFTVSPKPSLSYSPNPIVLCSGTATAITLSGGTNYAWTTSSNPNITGATAGNSNGSLNLNLTNSSSSIQHITYSIIASAGTCSALPVDVDVSVNPGLTIHNVTEAGSRCVGSSGVLIGLDNSQTGITYELLNNGTSTGQSKVSAGGAFTFNPVGAGNFTVLGKAGSCSINMNGSLAVQLISLPGGTGTISGPLSTCAGKSETYQVSGLSNATSYQWTFPSEVTVASSVQGSSVSVDIVGGNDFTISVIGENQCGTGGSAQLNISMQASPQVSIVLPDEVYAEEEAGFSYTTSSTIAGDLWDFGDGGSATGQTVFYTYTQGGSYKIQVQITDNAGCKGQDVQGLLVKPKASLSDLHIKNVVTANGDLQNAFLYIEDIEKFPNNEVLLLDRWGVEVFHENEYDNDWDLKRNGNYLPAGNYVCIVKLKDTGEVFKRAVTVLKDE